MPVGAYALADLLGAEVVAGREEIGRLCDVGVRLEDDGWPVTAIRVRSSTGEIDVPWSDVRTLEVDHLDVTVAARPGRPAHGTTWLATAVLDHELIDVDGKRLVRIGDVVLECRGDGLVAVGVEIGLAAVVRRLGLRRLARRLQRDLVPISVVHVPGAPHDPLTVETSRIRLASLEEHELAGLLDHLPHPVAGALIATLEPARAERTGHHLARRRAWRRAHRRLTNFRAP